MKEVMILTKEEGDELKEMRRILDQTHQNLSRLVFGKSSPAEQEKALERSLYAVGQVNDTLREILDGVYDPSEGTLKEVDIG